MKSEKFLNNKNYPLKFCLKPVAVSLIFATAFYSIKVIATFGVPSVQAQSVPNSEALTKDWYDYTPSDRSYRVKFPGQPSEEDLSVNSAIGTLKTVLVLYRDQTKQRFYGAMSYKYPVNPDIYDVEKGLDGARDKAVQNTNSTILREIKLSINGIPGREMTMQNSKGETTLMRTFIDPKGPTIYIALVGSNSNVDFPEARAFVNSFEPVQLSQ